MVVRWYSSTSPRSSSPSNSVHARLVFPCFSSRASNQKRFFDSLSCVLPNTAAVFLSGSMPRCTISRCSPSASSARPSISRVDSSVLYVIAVIATPASFARLASFRISALVYVAWSILWRWCSFAFPRSSRRSNSSCALNCSPASTRLSSSPLETRYSSNEIRSRCAVGTSGTELDSSVVPVSPLDESTHCPTNASQTALRGALPRGRL